MKKILVFILLTGIYLNPMAQTQVQQVKLATGVFDGNNTLLAYGDHDDTWRVETPGGVMLDAKICLPFAGWAVSPGCSQWITPHIKNNHLPDYCNPGVYTFKTSFNMTAVNPCIPITSAIVNFSQLGGDNNVHTFSINGHSYSIRPGYKDFLTLTPEIINLNTTDLVVGQNNIEIEVSNSTEVSGLNICGLLTITRTPVPLLQPSFNVNATYCQGNQLSFNGDDGPGTATSHYWEIQEWNNGPVTGGYLWSATYSGAPGNFTFPIASLLPCNKNYKVKLAVWSNCQGWTEANRYFYFACFPYNAGSNQSVSCAGNCVNIGTSGQLGYQYNWTVSGSTISIGTGAQVTVCPVSTTTYTRTTTGGGQGCQVSDNVTVFVQSNDPNFTLSQPILDGSQQWATLTATPVVTNANTIPGFGEMYIVEEINPNTLATIPGTRSSDGINFNPPCWWIYPLAVNFKGYDGTKYLPGDPIQNVSQNANCHLVTPAPGKFKICRSYRITRGTWNANCAWAQVSKTFTVTCPAGSAERAAIVLTETKNAPDYSYLRPQNSAAQKASPGNILIYPNPGTGTFTINTSKPTGGTLIVYDQQGKELRKIVLANKQANYTLNLSGHEPGTYMVKLITKERSYSEKLVLLKQ